MGTRREYKEYSFKAVGKTKSQLRREDRNRILDRPPVGLKTPLAFGYEEGLFAMHRSLEHQIADNLRNLLMTNHGERLGLYDFGANLEPLCFDLQRSDWEDEAMNRIRKAVKKYMPYVKLDKFVPYIDHHDNSHVGTVIFRVIYTISGVTEKLKAIEVVFQVGG